MDNDFIFDKYFIHLTLYELQNKKHGLHNQQFNKHYKQCVVY